MDFHMHSQVHSFCSMLVHGNTPHGRGTPSLLRVPHLLFRQVNCCSGHTQQAFLLSVRHTLMDLSSFTLLLFALPGTHSRVCLHFAQRSGALSRILSFVISSMPGTHSTGHFFTVAGTHSRRSCRLLHCTHRHTLTVFFFLLIVRRLFTGRSPDCCLSFVA